MKNVVMNIVVMNRLLVHHFKVYVKNGKNQQIIQLYVNFRVVLQIDVVNVDVVMPVDHSNN
jgi:hypothetical protein